MNEYDSHRMADLLGDSHGYVLTTDPKEADILLMNTCSIREKAQEKVFSELPLAQAERKNPDLIIGVGGCVASQEGDNIQKRANYVDMIFGPQTLHRLPQMLDQHFEQVEKPKKKKLNWSIFRSRTSKNLTSCLNHVLKVIKPLFRSWKAVQNTVLSV